MNEKKNVTQQPVRLPCGGFCAEGKCGDCVYFDYSRQGTSDRDLYLCRYHDKFRYPWDTSNYYCSHFTKR